jgi:geranylgeranyl diphosphate synthase, type I
VASPTTPASLGAIGARAAARIEDLLVTETSRWEAVDQALADPLRSLRSLVATGGKRLRPAFCSWGYVAGGGTVDDPCVVAAGAALELLHTFALIHDDIMDGSATRRTLPTIHIDYAGRHRRHQWRGEARRFGDGAAILIGDLAFVYADQLMNGAPPPAIDVFNELRLEVNVGQYLDLVGTATGQATVEQARTIGLYKSGKYTVERPLHLGAALAGRLDLLAEPLSAYGVPLGEAFQLRDDLLGAFGGDELLGKGVGDDFREGKPTALYAAAAARATGADAQLLRERFGQADLTDEDVGAIQEIFSRTGARAEVEATVDALLEEAVASLDTPVLAEQCRDELRALARFVVGRDH